MNRIILFFTAACACVYMVVYSMWEGSWLGMSGWITATLFSLIITLLFIINTKLRNYDEPED